MPQKVQIARQIHLGLLVTQRGDKSCGLGFLSFIYLKHWQP